MSTTNSSSSASSVSSSAGRRDDEDTTSASGTGRGNMSSNNSSSATRTASREGSCPPRRVVLPPTTTSSTTRHQRQTETRANEFDWASVLPGCLDPSLRVLFGLAELARRPGPDGLGDPNGMWTNTQLPQKAKQEMRKYAYHRAVRNAFLKSDHDNLGLPVVVHDNCSSSTAQEEQEEGETRPSDQPDEAFAGAAQKTRFSTFTVRKTRNAFFQRVWEWLPESLRDNTCPMNLEAWDEKPKLPKWAEYVRHLRSVLESAWSENSRSACKLFCEEDSATATFRYSPAQCERYCLQTNRVISRATRQPKGQLSGKVVPCVSMVSWRLRAARRGAERMVRHQRRAEKWRQKFLNNSFKNNFIMGQGGKSRKVVLVAKERGYCRTRTSKPSFSHWWSTTPAELRLCVESCATQVRYERLRKRRIELRRSCSTAGRDRFYESPVRKPVEIRCRIQPCGPPVRSDEQSAVGASLHTANGTQSLLPNEPGSRSSRNIETDGQQRSAVWQVRGNSSVDASTTPTRRPKNGTHPRPERPRMPFIESSPGRHITRPAGRAAGLSRSGVNTSSPTPRSWFEENLNATFRAAGLLQDNDEPMVLNPRIEQVDADLHEEADVVREPFSSSENDSDSEDGEDGEDSSSSDDEEDSTSSSDYESLDTTLARHAHMQSNAAGTISRLTGEFLSNDSRGTTSQLEADAAGDIAGNEMSELAVPRENADAIATSSTASTSSSTTSAAGGTTVCSTSSTTTNNIYSAEVFFPRSAAEEGIFSVTEPGSFWWKTQRGLLQLPQADAEDTNEDAEGFLEAMGGSTSRPSVSSAPANLLPSTTTSNARTSDEPSHLDEQIMSNQQCGNGHAVEMDDQTGRRNGETRQTATTTSTDTRSTPRILELLCAPARGLAREGPQSNFLVDAVLRGIERGERTRRNGARRSSSDAAQSTSSSSSSSRPVRRYGEERSSRSRLRRNDRAGRRGEQAIREHQTARQEPRQPSEELLPSSTTRGAPAGTDVVDESQDDHGQVEQRGLLDERNHSGSSASLRWNVANGTTSTSSSATSENLASNSTQPARRSRRTAAVPRFLSLSANAAREILTAANTAVVRRPGGEAASDERIQGNRVATAAADLITTSDSNREEDVDVVYPESRDSKRLHVSGTDTNSRSAAGRLPTDTTLQATQGGSTITTTTTSNICLSRDFLGAAPTSFALSQPGDPPRNNSPIEQAREIDSTERWEARDREEEEERQERPTQGAVSEQLDEPRDAHGSQVEVGGISTSSNLPLDHSREAAPATTRATQEQLEVDAEQELQQEPAAAHPANEDPDPRFRPENLMKMSLTELQAIIDEQAPYDSSDGINLIRDVLTTGDQNLTEAEKQLLFNQYECSTEILNNSGRNKIGLEEEEVLRYRYLETRCGAAVDGARGGGGGGQQQQHPATAQERASSSSTSSSSNTAALAANSEAAANVTTSGRSLRSNPGVSCSTQRDEDYSATAIAEIVSPVVPLGHPRGGTAAISTVIAPQVSATQVTAPSRPAERDNSGGSRAETERVLRETSQRWAEVFRRRPWEERNNREPDPATASTIAPAHNSSSPASSTSYIRDHPAAETTDRSSDLFSTAGRVVPPAPSSSRPHSTSSHRVVEDSALFRLTLRPSPGFSEETRGQHCGNMRAGEQGDLFSTTELLPTSPPWATPDTSATTATPWSRTAGHGHVFPSDERWMFNTSSRSEHRVHDDAPEDCDEPPFLHSEQAVDGADIEDELDALLELDSPRPQSTDDGEADTHGATFEGEVK
ncbi:unnamed protein product [Amoebophrya sp. A120]|nr:unnamed protein product [Amoebophrya sp. A120]|eukprot:GSA120T00013055001.1